MPKRFLPLLFFTVFLPYQAQATFDTPYMVYTLENYDAGDAGYVKEVPHDRYLYPHVYNDNMGSDPETLARYILERLTVLKPALYQGTELTSVDQKKYPLQTVVFTTAVAGKKDFMVMLCELVTSLSVDYDKVDPVTVIFHFKNKALEKEYGGKESTFQDIPYSVFFLKAPTRKK